MNLFAWAPFLLYFLIADEQVRAETDVLQIVGAYDQFFKMPDGLAEPDAPIIRCYNTICRDWMHECHWFCDKGGKSNRCMECLSWRGQHCYDCFHLL